MGCTWGVCPSPAVSQCVLEKTWKEMIGKIEFKTGGLGRKIVDGKFEVWVCLSDHYSCSEQVDDALCFTFSEQHNVFVPWGFSKELSMSIA